jgi:hypothetical protein
MCPVGVTTEVKLRLNQNDPAAGRTRTAEVERPERAAEARGGASVAGRGSGLGDERPADESWRPTDPRRHRRRGPGLATGASCSHRRT